MALATKYDVISVGSATEDIMIQVDSAKVVTLGDVNGSQSYLALEYGGKMHVDSILVSVGGGAVNTAISFATMGLRAGVVSKLGRDGGGERIRQRLQEAGVSTDLLVLTDQHSTGYSTIITTWTGERTVLVHRGASSQLTESDLDWERLAHSQWLYVGALAGQSWRLYPVFAELARRHDIKLALNLGTSQLDQGIAGFAEVLSAAHIIFQNLEETRRLTGVPPEQGDRDEREMMRMLHDVGVDIVVVTDGPRGASAWDGQTFYSIPAYAVDEVCNLGAGDAFAAACICALHRGLTIPESLRLGAANAASVVTQLGANRGLLTWEQALEFVARHQQG